MVDWFQYTPLKKGDYEYSPTANAFGWLIAMIAILSVPAVAIAQYVYKVFVEYKDLDKSDVSTLHGVISLAWRTRV